MRFIIQSIVLVVISCTMMGTDSYIDRLYAFHQNYPEFDTEEEVEEIYEVLKNAPNFESKLLQIENMTDLINAGCSMNMVMSVEPSESDTAKSMLEICDNEVIAMKMECDEHYDLMKYCKDKDNFMMDYIIERNLNENLSGGVASISPN
jgi:hypothetical protein